MQKEIKLYTGILTYKDVEFSFVFDESELRLIPPKEMEGKIQLEWLMSPLGNGVYAMGETPIMEEPFLVGRCHENGNKIIFITKQGSYIGSQNYVIFIDLAAYIICKYDREKIDRISFSSPEINCIHPINQAYDCSFDLDNNGIINITTKDYASTTTETQKFMVDGIEISARFGVSRGFSTKINEAPLSLNSSFMFEFEATDNYQFLHRLWRIAKSFIQFLCYRKNVCISQADLSSPYEGGKHEQFATLYIIGENTEVDTYSLQNGRYIKQQYIAGAEGKILSDIAVDMIYTRHIPDSYKAGRHIDAARFVMITAAFEWEYHRTNPEGVPRSPSRIDAETNVQNSIQEQINNSTGKTREIYKRLYKLIKTDSLQNEIKQISDDFVEIIDVFGKNLYRMNKEELIYSDMGKRIANQRNHFAHGDLDKEFIGLSLLDLIFMEYIIYAMQLKHYDIDNKVIQRAVNELFRCGIAI